MAEIFCGRTAAHCKFPAATELLASKSLPPLIVSIQYIPTAFMGGLQIKVVRSCTTESKHVLVPATVAQTKLRKSVFMLVV